jgi:hypothetical protein
MRGMPFQEKMTSHRTRWHRQATAAEVSIAAVREHALVSREDCKASAVLPAM